MKWCEKQNYLLILFNHISTSFYVCTVINFRGCISTSKGHYKVLTCMIPLPAQSTNLETPTDNMMGEFLSGLNGS